MPNKRQKRRQNPALKDATAKAQENEPEAAQESGETKLAAAKDKQAERRAIYEKQATEAQAKLRNAQEIFKQLEENAKKRTAEIKKLDQELAKQEQAIAKLKEEEERRIAEQRNLALSSEQAITITRKPRTWSDDKTTVTLEPKIESPEKLYKPCCQRFKTRCIELLTESEAKLIQQITKLLIE